MIQRIRLVLNPVFSKTRLALCLVDVGSHACALRLGSDDAPCLDEGRLVSL